MDEAERCHRLAFILNGNLLTQGTISEVARQTHLTTWSVSGPNLAELAERLRRLPEVEQAAAFGSALHVSGVDAAQLEKAIDPFRTDEYKWSQAESGLEDIFIHLMAKAKGGSSL